MTWDYIPHTNCQKPLFNLSPTGSIWRCDYPGCGKRWRMTRQSGDASGRQTITWARL